MQKGQERLKIAAWLWSKFFLVHEEVPHGLAAKNKEKGIGFKEKELFLHTLKIYNLWHLK